MCLAPGAPLAVRSVLHVIAPGVLHTHTQSSLCSPSGLRPTGLWCIAWHSCSQESSVDWMDGIEGGEAISKPSSLGRGQHCPPLALGCLFRLCLPLWQLLLLSFWGGGWALRKAGWVWLPQTPCCLVFPQGRYRSRVWCHCPLSLLLPALSDLTGCRGERGIQVMTVSQRL